ncbi:ABC transporter permease [uncultured Cohaesibacter sp.]|uniref:ABC transporter permease n=1 Tax=uncultured Cohaesibacter sp. TaxID=1002546 RepID=UPI0029C9A83D|nr:ABC transporter permease [uncultured Cohaesibacter sp.]
MRPSDLRSSAERRSIRPPALATILILPGLLLLVWHLGSTHGWFNAYLLPPPIEVWTAAVDLWGKGLLAEHLGVSLMRVLIGFALSGLSALLLAALNYRFPLARRMTFLPLEAIRVIPPLALVPVLILWFGIGEGSKLAVIVLASFFPVYLSALTALQTVDPKLLQMAQTLNLSPLERVRFVLIPGASAGLATGLRLGFGYAWRALVGAELIAASAGLGYLILDSEELARTDRIFVGIIVIALTGMILDAIFRRMLPRDDRQRMLGGIF